MTVAARVRWWAAGVVTGAVALPAALALIAGVRDARRGLR